MGSGVRFTLVLYLIPRGTGGSVCEHVIADGKYTSVLPFALTYTQTQVVVNSTSQDGL